MRQTFEEYRCEVVENAERFAQAQEVREQENHLMAFNLGRMVERIQNPRRRVRQPVRWLLVGLAIGIVFGRIFPHYVYHSFAGKFLIHPSIIQNTAGNTGPR